MAIDTRDKRSSAVNAGSPWRGLLPGPDGTLNQADRQHAGLFYRGILAAVAAGEQPARRRYWAFWPQPIGPTHVQII